MLWSSSLSKIVCELIMPVGWIPQIIRMDLDIFNMNNVIKPKLILFI